MASTAATVFFCRPGRMSLRAVLTGFFDCAHVVCAIADAARNSKAWITKVLFILSSFQFGFQLAFSKRMLCHCMSDLGVYSLRQDAVRTANPAITWSSPLLELLMLNRNIQSPKPMSSTLAQRNHWVHHGSAPGRKVAG